MRSRQLIVNLIRNDLLSSSISSLFISLYVLFELRQADPKFFPDSGGYLPEGTIYSVGDWTGEAWGTLSIFGNSVRPWPIILLYSLFDSNSSKIIFQTFFYIASVTTLIFAINKLLSKFEYNRIKIFINFILIVYFTQPHLLQWNFVILSESISISLLICYFSTILFLVSNIKLMNTTKFKIYLFLNLFIIFSLSIIKFAFVLFFLLNLCFLFLFLTKYASRFFSTVYLFLIISMPIVSYLTNANMDSFWGSGSKPGRIAINYFYLTAEGPNTPTAPIVRRAVWQVSPNCLQDVIAPESNPYGVLNTASEKCPEGVVWLNENFSSWYLNFLVENPRYVIVYLQNYSKYSFLYSEYFALSTSLMPPHIYDVFFNYTSDISMYNLLYLNIFIFLTLFFILSFLQLFYFSKTILLFLTATILSFISYSLNLILINSELSRTTLISNTSIHLTLFILLVFFAEYLRLINRKNNFLLNS